MRLAGHAAYIEKRKKAKFYSKKSEGKRSLEDTGIGVRIILK
jgi:hypothetical protein